MLLVFLACLTEQPIAGDSEPPAAVDEDGDGWPVEDDCDDTEPTVNPDAEEVCNGIDDDCDEVIDTDATDRETFYADVDSDGYGDPESTTLACEAADGWVDNDLDCDDTEPSVYEGADEICDYLDNDCDGDTDEDGLTRYYIDADSDGYGDLEDQGEETCGVPEGKVPDNSDCDDGRFETNPGADEYCNGIDDDCDGDIDPDSSVDAPTWYIDADSDEYGSTDYTLVQCEQPGGYVPDDNDCDDLDGEINPGADERCNGVDDDCDGDIDEDDAIDATTWYADSDADGYGDIDDSLVQCEEPSGYVDNDGDCDDNDDAVSPDEDELCSTALDDDCDGDVNEDDAADASDWYADDDNDGYGDSSNSQTACDQPSDYVSDSGDCDDKDADANPGADEYCDGHDDDCDGDVDEDDAVDAETWYGDDDSDGYGEDADSATACDQPSGYERKGGDCDDRDDDIYPGADEYCNTEDDDCDGDIDEDDAIDAETWYADIDGDSYGDSTATSDACDQPSGYVSDDTDCDDTESAVNPGETEVCGDGLDNDCDEEIGSDCGPYGTVQLGSSREAKISGDDAGDYVGYSVDAADIDGDGYADMLVGAPYAQSAYVFYGPVTTDYDASEADLIVTGPLYYGLEVHAVGDLDSDGVTDLAVGNHQASTTLGDGTTVSNHGLVSLFYGPGTGSLTSDDADAWIEGESIFDFIGTQVESLGDMDGDGFDDLVVGSAYNSAAANYGGMAAVYYGPLSGELDHEPTERVEGAAAADYLGAAVSPVDADGDGTPDLAVGAIGAAEAYLVFGPVTTTVSSTDADVLLSGTSGDYTGRSFTAPGDVDGDGYEELIVGSPKYNSSAGYAWVLHGPLTTDKTLASDYDMRLVGPASGYGGYTLASCDINGDGDTDIVAGSPGTGTWKGKAYILLGPLTAGSYLMSSTAEGTLAGEGTYEYLSHHDGLGCADTDADGNDDVVVGAYANDEGGAYAGAAYVVLGGEGL